jgi:hypothetical protein
MQSDNHCGYDLSQDNEPVTSVLELDSLNVTQKIQVAAAKGQQRHRPQATEIVHHEHSDLRE